MEECHPRKEDQGKLDSEVGEGRMRRNTLRRRQQVHQLGDQVVQKRGPYGTTQEKKLSSCRCSVAAYSRNACSDNAFPKVYAQICGIIDSPLYAVQPTADIRLRYSRF